MTVIRSWKKSIQTRDEIKKKNETIDWKCIPNRLIVEESLRKLSNSNGFHIRTWDLEIKNNETKYSHKPLNSIDAQ